MKYGKLTLAALILAFIQGCDRTQSEHEQLTLVVDMAAVARAVGKDDEINATLNQAREQLNARLKTLVNSLNTELDSAKEKLGGQAAEHDQLAYTKLAGEAASRIKQSQQAAQLKLNTMQNNLLVTFRNKIREVAAELARQRGAALVQLTGADLLWFEPEADITDEVIAQLRARTNTNSGKEASSSNPVDQTTRNETEKLNELVEKLENKP